MTLEEAILYLLEKFEAMNFGAENKDVKIESERKTILALMEKKFYGINQEDSKEYDFEDICS